MRQNVSYDLYQDGDNDMAPKMQIVWEVLEAAKAHGDQFVIAACRKCIEANRLGWKRHNGAAAYAIVSEFVA